MTMVSFSPFDSHLPVSFLPSTSAATAMPAIASTTTAPRYFRMSLPFLIRELAGGREEHTPRRPARRERLPGTLWVGAAEGTGPARCPVDPPVAVRCCSLLSARQDRRQAPSPCPSQDNARLVSRSPVDETTAA